MAAATPGPACLAGVLTACREGCRAHWPAESPTLTSILCCPGHLHLLLQRHLSLLERSSQCHCLGQCLHFTLSRAPSHHGIGDGAVYPQTY